jgi:hypothetical protein
MDFYLSHIQYDMIFRYSLAVKRSRVPPIRSGLILHPEDQRVTMSKIGALLFLPEFCQKMEENRGKSIENTVQNISFRNKQKPQIKYTILHQS